MFEARVLHLLRRYLGEYVCGLSVETLTISVWKGDVVLKDLQLKAEALNALKLPITVKAGFLGSVTLKVPWNRLGNEPVIVLLDRIFILAEPLKESSSKTEDKENWLELKRRRIEEKELIYLEAKDKKTASGESASETSTWLGSLIATIVGNLKISITNLHIRYEDTISNPGRPFCAGVTLAKLAAVTVDETGNETFVTSGALERLQKKLELQRLALYHDSNTRPWNLDKGWEDLLPSEWSEVFEVGISTDVPPDAGCAKWAVGRRYLLHPVDGSMLYHRHGKRESREPHVPFQWASLRLDQVSVTVSEAQYGDGMKLLEGVSRYRMRMQYSQLRPQVSIAENAQAWWLYACQAVLQQQSRIWYPPSWAKMIDVCKKRRKYVSLYASCLHQGRKVDNEGIRELEKNLDIDVILLWRLLAHAKMETAKAKEAAMERERVRRSGWWTFGWGTADGNRATSMSSAKSDSETETPGRLTKEEWSKINDLLSYKPEEESAAIFYPEAPNMLQMELEVSIGRSGAEVLDNREMQILCGRFEDLQVSLLRYPKTEKCNVKLKFYGLSAPEGGLIESVSRIGRDHALTTSFVYFPLDEHLDWKLSATMSPCHVTVLRVSFDRFLQFLKSSQDLSPGVASETAAVLQSKLEEVTRRAQEQLQLVLEEQSRFSVHLDLDGPKIAIPVGALESGEGTQLLLDLGHFTLQTALEEEYEVDHTGLYSRFHISGSEISAFLADGPFEWSDLPLSKAAAVPEEVSLSESPEDKSSSVILPVLDRCGMSVVLDQIRVQHPSFPATRVQIKVPRLGVHFSPGRHRRMLLLLSALDGGGPVVDAIETRATVHTVPAWHPADYAGDARVLLWGGIGNTVAEWQTCWAVLSGSYLYILETETAQNYQRCSSIAGKQVLEVSPDSIGGSQNVIAICYRGVDVQKAVESSHAVLLQLKSEENQAAWSNCLVRAAYKASVPFSISVPEFTGSECDDADQDPSDLNKQPRLFVSGSLHELQISLIGSKTRPGYVGVNPRHEETLILQLQATGGKVDVLQRQYETLIGVTLHSLKIEDKLQGHVGPSCHYIARSVLSSGTSNLELGENGRPKSGWADDNGSEEDDDENFDDALQDFDRESPDQSPSSATIHSSRLQASRSMDKPLPSWGLDEFSVLNAEALLERTFTEHEEEEVSDFVKMRLAFRHKESLDYAGVDTQINIRMATLDFFCNRPTVVAMIDFGMEFSEMMDGDAPANSQPGSTNAPLSTQNVGVAERHIVKGLLGHGKSRVIFQLMMNMESVRIYLNKEDGSQLAVLAQDRFKLSIKVYPGSFSVSGMLGNLRVCDSLLGPDHRWGWLCDIRDPGCGSLVELDFHSYNKDDDDYQGYDYSLSGKLSAVRIVFLYRFIQEIIAYFHALASPQVQQVITVVDKVGGIEKLIQQSDMEGTPALKLNVSLDTPIIIMPKNSKSKEFMQLDLGHLEIFNTFHWHGGGKSDPSAVHIDVTAAEVTDINMVVGIDSQPGKPMIEHAFGIHITVQRPLRDLFRKVPELQVGVEVDVLRGVMSDKEYLVIIDCASTNLSEETNLPPRFREQVAASDASNQEFMNLESPQEGDDQTGQASGSDGQQLTTWTKIRWNIDVRRVELELYVGVDRDSPLARMEIQRLWLSYCTTTALDMDLYITLPKLSVVDLRADTKPEMRLMLGSMSDVDMGTESVVEARASHERGNIGMQSETALAPQLTMLVMDMRMKQDSQAIMVRVQRPRLLVVVDFLLAVGEFFVPSLGSITGRNETMDVSKDPVIQHDLIRLQTAEYLQSVGTVILSEGRQLVADAFDIDEFVYDGGGKTLLLDISEDAISGLQSDLEPLIFIGCNKHLRFKNIRIKNGLWLSKVVHLSCNSSYSVAFDDGVVLEGFSDGQDSNSRENIRPGQNFASMSSMRISTPQMEKPNLNNFVLDVQAVAPELTFHDSTKWPLGTLPHRERLLRAKSSFNLLYIAKGQDQWIRGHVKSLVIEGGSGIVVVDPVDVTGEYTCVQDKTSMTITSSDISMRLSFNVISLILRCHLNAVSTFRFRDAQPVFPCTHFDRICVTNKGRNPSQQVTIWRPRAPPGYAILSDCATSGTAPPSQAVMAVSKAYQRLRKPLGFDLLLSTSDDKEHEEDGETRTKQLSADAGRFWSVWVPVAPPGYVAVGCVAELGTAPPPLSVVHCVRSDLVTSGSVSDCLIYLSPESRAEHNNGSSIWRIENAAGSFFAHSSIEPPPKSVIHDLRELLCHGLDNSGSDAYRGGTKPASPAAIGGSRRLENTSSVPSALSKTSRSLITTPQFERIWWDRGSESRRTVSIWRPIPPSGFATLGDCLVEGLEPPSFGVALRDDENGTLVKPTKYWQRMNTSGKGPDDVYIWFPVAPAGYVAIGCIATKTQQMPLVEHFRCIHVDHVSQVNFSKRPLWSMSTEKNVNTVWNIGVNRRNYNCSLWKVENQAQTFIARPDLKRPPAKMAFTLAEIGKQKLRDNLTSEVKIGRLSATIYDDLSGMLTPVVDMTVSNINLAAHGRKEAFSVVIISAIAASTFNVILEAWEPFIEPFDGIIKFESNDVGAQASLKIGKRFRITAANVVNVNLTSAAVDALVAATLSWRKQVEFEDKARMVLLVEEAQGKPSNLNFALEEEDLEKVVFENDIGNELYLRTFKENFQKVLALPTGQNALVQMPPPKFPDKFMAVSDAAQTRHFAVVHVSEAKDVIVRDDGNGQDYLCALRVVPALQSSEAQRLLPQSARTSCVKPSSLTQGRNSLLATVKWNEVFVVEVIHQAPVNLEVVVTNMASRGGKGQAVGVVSIPMNEQSGRRLSPSSLWDVVKHSLHLRSSWPISNDKTYTLLSPRKQEKGSERQKSGSITVSMFFFTSGPNQFLTGEKAGTGFKKEHAHGSDIGIWFSSDPEGPWTGVRSVQAVGTFPRQIGEQNLVVEVSMQQSTKHVKLRSLVMVVNHIDMPLEVCICPFSRLNSPDGRTATDGADIGIEEVFENQRFQPLGGWGSKWPGHLMPTDPGRWSSRDLSTSSQDFLDKPLPPGWVWTSDWVVDKAGEVDIEGWYHGVDFQSLRWPPSSGKARRKSVFDFARRRRWVRTRQRVPENTYVQTRHTIGMVGPASSISVPLSSFDSNTDFCVQVRPYCEPLQYKWGRSIGDGATAGSSQNNDDGSRTQKATVSRPGVPVSAFLLNQLEKTEELILCLPAPGVKSKTPCWLNMEADASILYTELNAPIYDWRLSVNAPLKIENRLPCKAEFHIWEKLREGNFVRKQEGVVSAGDRVYVYFLDLRRPVYLTWLAQGGWKPDLEAVLISDPSVESLPSGFWITHPQNHRKLRVSMENDFGNTAGSAKIVRLYVPYWLCNDAALPLSYRLVEIEPSGGGSGDNSWLNRAAKAAKQAARRPTRMGESKKSHLHKVVQSLELLEDSDGAPAMLSLQAQSDRIGGPLLASNAEGGRLSPRLGLVITIGNNTRCDYALSFRELEENMERVEFKAADGNGAYYKLSAFLDMSSDRTKVFHLQPQAVFVNRIGQKIRLRQGELQQEELLFPNDAPRTILWQSTSEPELLRISVQNYKWSQPFSVDTEGIMQTILEGEDGNYIEVETEVCSEMQGSRFLVVFRRASFHATYRIENRSAVLPFRYRQSGGTSESWKLLGPGSAAAFAWEDLQRDRLLELLVDGADPVTAGRFCIDDVGNYQPMPTKGGPVAALNVRVCKEGLMKVIKVADWKPSDSDLSIVPFNSQLVSPQPSELLQPEVESENQFHAILELAELGISIVDHTPEELLYMTMQKLVVQYATGLGSGTRRFKLRVDGLQIDNQLPLTPMPVLFTAQDFGNHPEFLLKLTATTSDHGMADYQSYPYIGIHGPSVPGVAFVVKIHEPILWRLHEMFRLWDLSRLTSSKTTDVAIDRIIHIGLLHTTEVRLKVTLVMSPTQRPRGMLGFWSTLMTSLGNTDEMPIRINSRVQEEMTMRQSVVIATAVSSIRNDVLSKPLSLLSGVDLLGNASTAFGHMSKGVAALSMDKKFIRSRTRQDTKANVEDIGDGIREGGEALAKGFFRGVTGILTKPLEGAQSSGMEGFVQGMGKGVIGAAIQPVSGVLDFLSRTTEGANATRMKLTAAITFEEQMLRRRLPRVIGGDNVLRPYDEYKARGQVLMQLAERGAIFGPIDLFKVRGKFAMSDAYEDHFNLPKGRTLMITHRRIILLQHPKGFVVQKKADLLKDPCTVTWDVTWDDLMTTELAHGKEEPLHIPQSRLIIHLRSWSQDARLFDSKEIARIVKCHPGTKQASEMRLAIQRAHDMYGPDRSNQARLQKRPSTRKPYAGVGTGAASGAALGLLAGPAAPVAVPVMATFGALMGSAGEAMLETDGELPSTEDNLSAARRSASVDQPNFKTSMPDSTMQIGRITTDFELMWWDKGAPWSKKFQVSIWRPVPSAGFVSVGDVVQCCYDPPDKAMVYNDERDGKFVLPNGFDLVWRDTESGARDPVTIWRPRPPAGYVAVGCVVVPDYCEPEREVLRCVRRDAAGNVALGQVPLWRNYKGAALWHCSLWQVQNEARTFLARRDHQPPPPNLAFTVL